MDYAEVSLRLTSPRPIMSTDIQFPSGLYFVKGHRALAETVFRKGGTASGYYQARKNGVLFSRPNGEPWFFLVINRYGERFFVSCGTRSDGCTVYFHALSSNDTETLFPRLSYGERHAIARELAQSFTGQN